LPATGLLAVLAALLRMLMRGSPATHSSLAREPAPLD